MRILNRFYGHNKIPMYNVCILNCDNCRSYESNIYKVEHIRKGPFTKDAWLTPGRESLQISDVQLLFDCNSILLSGRRGEGV